MQHPPWRTWEARLCHTGLFQVMYKEKDSEARAQFWLAEGNTSRSAQLTGLGKFMLYEIRVLAFTRIGDGVPSRPPILERTLDDGECQCTDGQKDSKGVRGTQGV